MTEPTAYYVSAIEGRRKALASGPYDSHDEALAAVAWVRETFLESSPDAAFAAWGTAGFKGPRDEAPIGVLEKARPGARDDLIERAKAAVSAAKAAGKVSRR